MVSVRSMYARIVAFTSMLYEMHSNGTLACLRKRRMRVFIVLMPPRQLAQNVIREYFLLKESVVMVSPLRVTREKSGNFSPMLMALGFCLASFSNCRKRDTGDSGFLLMKSLTKESFVAEFALSICALSNVYDSLAIFPLTFVIDKIKSISVEDAIAASKKIKLDTVYFLKN